MSPAGTRARVYQLLKARVMAGEFAPGERIDPARLAPDLAASVTPIRDALHRLAGERLVESSSQEGFRQPLVNETALRHLYGWSEDLLRLLLRAGEHERARLVQPPRAGEAQDHAIATAIRFDLLASLLANFEHRAAVTSLNERAYVVRRAEPLILPAPLDELDLLVEAVAEARWADARRASQRYHAVRLRHVPALAAALLTRSSR